MKRKFDKKAMTEKWEKDMEDWKLSW